MMSLFIMMFSYGLSWNNNSKGYLLSASDDHVRFNNNTRNILTFVFLDNMHVGYQCYSKGVCFNCMITLNVHYVCLYMLYRMQGP